MAIKICSGGSEPKNIYVWVDEGGVPTQKSMKGVYVRKTEGGILTEHKIRPSSRLPSTYQEVEWIGGTNGSNRVPQVYINTGVTTSNNIGAWTEMLHTATRNDVQWFTNDLDSSSPKNARRGLTTYPSGNWCPQWTTWHQTNIASSINTWYDIKLNWNNNKKTLIDGTNIYSLGSSTFSSTDVIRIGDISYNGYGWKCKYFKMTNGTTLIRDLVPCYRIADSVIGMYDLVNNTFYTNAGTGTLTKGPNV